MSQPERNRARTLRVHHWQPDKEGKLSESALHLKLSRLGYDCRRYEYPPGTRFPEHSHAMDKIDAVITGRFRISSGRQSVELGPGDYVHVPRGLVHSAEVIGDETVVSIDGTRTVAS